MNLISKQPVSVSFNSKNYLEYTDTNGDASILIDTSSANLGKQDISINVCGINSTSAVNILPTIGGDNCVKFYGDNAPFEIRLFDQNGQALSAGRLISYQIDGERTKHTLIQNDEGIVSLDISSLTPGEHNLTVINELTKEIRTFTITVHGGFGSLNNNLKTQNDKSVDSDSPNSTSSNDNSINSDSINEISSNSTSVKSTAVDDYALVNIIVNSVNGVFGDSDVTNHSGNASVSKSIDNTPYNDGNNIWLTILSLLAIIGLGGLIRKNEN